jgi:uncharacterized protein
MTETVAALTLGLAGSLHCVVMCGPLVLAIGPCGQARVGLYHAARVSVYASLGLVGGLAGHVVNLAGLGGALSVIAGMVLLMIAARSMGVTFGASPAGGWIGRPLGRVMRTGGRLTAARPALRVIAAGALNGLVPCGLVYAALVTATTLGSATRAVAFMLAFGLGTVGPLAAMPLIAQSIPVAARARMRVAIPLAIALVGLLLITRGALTFAPRTANADHAARHLHLH